jgi:hypothetical protein
MRQYIIAIVPIFALFTSGAALAQNTQPVPTADQNSTAVPSSKLTCHFVYHEGMVIGRACRTKEEWEHTRYETQKEISDYQLRSMGPGH